MILLNGQVVKLKSQYMQFDMTRYLQVFNY